ncbi:hypothetical protein PRZ48_000095 [Zasmidium cellare]|uniref:Uncharacterized protein n=1 Tax=Zasmidium cellare TaxID=395010 RepID=A0ABR0EYS9_ZASCE|nr:hypothetical protein PRZ48_000095 [Zasmidium cellare]
MATQSKTSYDQRVFNGDGCAMDPIQAPSESANSSEVRSFIVEVLVRQYDIDEEHAKEIAQHWDVGSGRELRQFPARLFVEIFGLQAGWVLYKEVSARAIEEKVNSMDIFNHKKRAIGREEVDPRRKPESQLRWLFRER